MRKKNLGELIAQYIINPAFAMTGIIIYAFGLLGVTYVIVTWLEEIARWI
jgi:uncharacterized membrane protein YcaP (DUF421 family)